MSSAPPVKLFTCKACGSEFALPRQTRDQYPGWTPPLCPRCFGSGGRAPARPGQQELAVSAPASPGPARAREPAATLPAIYQGPALQPVEDPWLEQALEQAQRRYQGGPGDGLFTDGGAIGNPGPGGWAAVLVQGNKLLGRRFGRATHTTNNRMELCALIAAFQMVDADQPVVIHSDSDLCVKTITTWARGWERRGWRRKGGPIANLELVQEAYALAQARPLARLRWIKAHSGNRWNEYADTLATGELQNSRS
jgi:ribonuclease HI